MTRAKRIMCYPVERPVKHSIWIYPAQLKMIDEISRVWEKEKRIIFYEAIQQYIGQYWQWKNQKKK